MCLNIYKFVNIQNKYINIYMFFLNVCLFELRALVDAIQPETTDEMDIPDKETIVWRVPEWIQVTSFTFFPKLRLLGLWRLDN